MFDQVIKNLNRTNEKLKQKIFKMKVEIRNVEKELKNHVEDVIEGVMVAKEHVESVKYSTRKEICLLLDEIDRLYDNERKLLTREDSMITVIENLYRYIEVNL